MNTNLNERRRKAADNLVRLSALNSLSPSARIYNLDTHDIDIEKIQNYSWSTGEEVLIQTLLFCLDVGHHAPTLREIFYQLDDDNRSVVIETLRILNGYEPAWT